MFVAYTTRVHAGHTHTRARVQIAPELTYPPIRAIGVAANCTYHPQHNWTRAKRRKDTTESFSMHRVYQKTRIRLEVSARFVHYTHIHMYLYSCVCACSWMSESGKFQARTANSASAVILKGFNDSEWKFILRSGYERLTRDKLPLVDMPDMYKTCSVAKRARFRIKPRYTRCEIKIARWTRPCRV